MKRNHQERELETTVVRSGAQNIEPAKVSQNGWRRLPLGDVAKVISGYAFKSGEFCDNGIPVIKIKNIRLGYIDLSEADRVNESYLKIPERYHIQAGDVLISLTGSHISQPNSVVGRVARHSSGLPLCLLNQRAGRIVVSDAATCDKDFLFYTLSEPETMRVIAMKAHGAASQANVSPTQVESIEILLHPLAEQRRIVGILSAYNNLVEQYLVFAEGQAMRRVPMHMADWLTKLHGFLSLNERSILDHAGKISHEMAKELAEAEFEKFRHIQVKQSDAVGSDFDKAVKQLPSAPKRKKGGMK